MRGHAGKKSSPWPLSLLKAAVNVYVRAGKSRGTLMVGMMMELMGLKPIHFSRLYNPPRRLTFPGVPCPPPLFLTMMDKIEKEVVLQLMELVDDEKNRRYRFVSFREVVRSISIHEA